MEMFKKTLVLLSILLFSSELMYAGIEEDLAQARKVIEQSYEPGVLKNDSRLKEQQEVLGQIFACLKIGRINRELFQQLKCAEVIKRGAEIIK
jgi:hypothetical protein